LRGKESSLSNDYAKEKLWQAVDILATIDLSIQERLAGAAIYLIRLKPDDLPEALRHDFDGVLHELTKEKVEGGEGTIAASTQKLTSEEGSKLAGRILHIYTELHGGI
jgi:hypothetical protein